jgi:hypothetical protein
MNDFYRDITWMSEQAARFRSLAEMEPIAALRRHLAALARQYEQLARLRLPTWWARILRRNVRP